jgi:glutaredoxin
VEDKMKKCILFLILLFFCLCNTATADYYKWVDENGNTQISDTPPPENKSAKDVEVHKAPAPEEPANLQNENDSAKNKPKLPSIILFTKNDCNDCDKARDFLQSKKLAFTEYNMDTDKNAVAKRKELDSGDDVPFAVINKSHVFGFSESVYNKVLKMEP